MSRHAGAAESPAVGDPVAWHDAENGAFAADLELFERLACRYPDGLADLGAGTGRVALPLAAAGHTVTAVDSDGALLDELADRARERGLDVATARCDVRALDLGRRFPLIIAPMQLLHILGGEAGRRRALAAVRSHLEPGGRFCAVVLEEPLPTGVARPDPVPDVREVAGWVHSSLPVEVRIDRSLIRMVRMRQLVTPGGGFSESRHVVELDRFSLADLDRDADAAGLWIVGCERLPSTIEFEDSIAVLMEARDG